MLTIAAHPDLAPAERSAAYTAAVARLRSNAATGITEGLEEHATTLADALGSSPHVLRSMLASAVLKPLGRGRLRVDADLYATLPDELQAKLVVLDSDAYDEAAEAEHDDEGAPADADAPPAEGGPAEGDTIATPETPDVGGAVVTTEPDQVIEEQDVHAGEAIEFDPASFPNIEALRDFARTHDLNLHGASTRAEVEEAILAALTDPSTSDDQEAPRG